MIAGIWHILIHKIKFTFLKELKIKTQQICTKLGMKELRIVTLQSADRPRDFTEVTSNNVRKF